METRRDAVELNVDRLIDKAMIGSLTDDEIAALDRKLFESDEAIERLPKRCQIESDLEHLMRGRAAAKLPLADGETLADHLEHERLFRPTDRAE